MVVYTYSEARQQLARLLDEVLKDGAVRIKRKDGQEFVVKPIRGQTFPLDVAGIDLGINALEIIQIVQEGRRYRA